jgi:ubiquinone/menaquinone biosynthesis C-methylase UbiE
LPSPTEAQSFSVKRSQVEFHNFASLGETERAIAYYLDENVRRAAVIEAHSGFIGRMTPFLEIGANAGHTSYMLANQFGGEGFALDISADALRHGVALMDRWQLTRAPIRVAGDAVNLPFRDGSMQFVMACQMLSQFMNIESVFLEVKRVLAPGASSCLPRNPCAVCSLRIYESLTRTA